MTAMTCMKAKIEMQQAILEAIGKAVKAGLDADEVKAILEAAVEAIDNHGTED